MDNGIEILDSFKSLLMGRIRPERNERRFYALAVTIDLFGDAVLMRHWGRIGSGGKQRTDRHDDVAGATASLERLARKKRRRGYEDRGVAHLPPETRASAR